MFELNISKLDYLTITTFEPSIMAELYKWHIAIGSELPNRKRGNYVGSVTNDRYGSSFCGVAKQGDREHVMMQVSGLLSESAFTATKEFVISGRARVTRIDLQITVDYDREVWSQYDLFCALKEENGGRSVNYRESKSGPQNSILATVYYGSRTSDNMVRIYEKRGLNDDIHLRFEVEYKSARAQEVHSALCAGSNRRALLWGQMLKLPDVLGLRRLYSPHLKTTPTYTTVVRESGDTERWLNTVVLKALDRFLAQHDENSAWMAERFARVISPYLDNPLTEHYNLL